MNFAKRGMLALLSFCVMLSVVAYINYKYDPEREKDLGQTVYVNSNQDVNIYEEEKKEQEEDSLAVFRYDRDNMFSELMETYNNIINNDNTSVESVNEYQNKLDQLVEKKTLLNMVENVIKSKGIEDVVIIPTNNDNLNIVIKSEEELELDAKKIIEKI